MILDLLFFESQGLMYLILYGAADQMHVYKAGIIFYYTHNCTTSSSLGSWHLTSLDNACLFTGNMNQHRLYNVWKITSEAIDELHRSLESCPGETAVAEDPAGLKVSQED